MNESQKISVKPHHLGISVADLEASIAWYCEKLEFTVVNRLTLDAIPAKIAFLQHGDFAVELFEVPGASPLPEDRRFPDKDLLTHGIKHIALAVKDTKKMVEKLKERGVDIAMDITEVDQSTIAFIRDNTGNLIEIFQQPALFE